MTAEIALLNKSAVALAADSAVTIGGGGDKSPKIFNTVNKLFTLSKYHPVGIMVYGSAQILGTPWETIIKMYRKKLGNRDFQRLQDYAEDFLKFLHGNHSFFPASEQANYFGAHVHAFYRRVNNDINKKIEKALSGSPKNANSIIKQIIRAVIDEYHTKFKKTKNLPGFSEKFSIRIGRKFKTQIRQIHSDVFQKLPIAPEERLKLETLAGWIFVKDRFGFNGASGVVIAGFGKKDIYPSLKAFTVEGVIENKLRFTTRNDVRIGSKTSASIIPFAQSEVVRGFIEGIDPSVEELLNQFLDNVFTKYPTVLLNHVSKLTPKAKAQAAKKANIASNEILKKFREAFNRFREENLVNPIATTVAVLPKDELAAMAETLVNLTAFKRKFSFDAETVGGPTDVAVLSKGDGFVWIKRKHYFKSELNTHFFTNYFRKD